MDLASAPALLPFTPSVRREQSDILLGVAVTLFASRGFHAVTTRDITRAAGVSPGTLYVYYPSKQELLFEIVRRSHLQSLDLMQEAASKPGTPAERLRRLVIAQVKFNAERREYAHVGNFELGNLTDQNRHTIMIIRRETEDLMRRTIENGVQIGELSVPDVALATTAALSLAIDVSRWFMPERRSAEELANVYADLVLQMLGGHP